MPFPFPFPFTNRSQKPPQTDPLPTAPSTSPVTGRPRRYEPNPTIDFWAGLTGGVLGRVATNNVTLGTFLWSSNPSLSLPSAFKQSMTGLGLRSCVFGAAIQNGAVYWTRTILSQNDVPPLPSALAAGAVSGAAMHPFVVRFLLQTPSNPAQLRWPASPAASGMVHFIRHHPKVFLRGIHTRLLMSSTDWAIYFQGREWWKKHAPAPLKGAHEWVAATAAIAISTPIFMIYGREIQTGESTWTAVRNIFLSGKGTAARGTHSRSAPAACMFIAWGVLEKLMIDWTKETCAEASASVQD